MALKFGPIFAALTKVFRGERPEKIVRALARDLVIDCKLVGPPFDPFECARLLSVPIEYAAIEAEGIFAGYPAKNPRIILPLRAEMSTSVKRRRLKFTLAHEIGHYVIRRSLEGCVPASIFMSEDLEEEYLCSLFASELLMPSNLIISEFREEGITPDVLCGLADRYDVSLQSMLCRVTQVWRGKVIAALWKWDEKGPHINWASPKKYQVRGGRQLRLRDTRHTSIERAFSDGGTHSGRDHFLLNGKGMWWYTSSLKLASSGLVLSVMQRDSKAAREKKLPKFICTNPVPQKLTPMPVQQFLPYPMLEPACASRKRSNLPREERNKAGGSANDTSIGQNALST